MAQFHYVYVLHSLKDGKNYIGYTKNLKLRFEQHQEGKVTSTKHRRPLKLIYFEDVKGTSKPEMIKETSWDEVTTAIKKEVESYIKRT